MSPTRSRSIVIGISLAGPPNAHHRTYGAVSGGSNWLRLDAPLSGTTFDEATIQRACQVIQPLSKVALTGDIRRVADVRNLELQSPRDDLVSYATRIRL
jgi:hypothetical protein